MDIVQNTKTSVNIQLGFWDSIKDLLQIDPVFILGAILIGIFLIMIFKRNNSTPKCRTSILSLVMYYYLCLIFTKIVVFLQLVNLADYHN